MVRRVLQARTAISAGPEEPDGAAQLSFPMDVTFESGRTQRYRVKVTGGEVFVQNLKFGPWYRCGDLFNLPRA